ncbi:DUF262 domain-containing HNH endonuclease family protein [Hyphomonas sp.]|uniref:DUF262 domain-containing protein n=1 Tax=Hyphomonas sp. TaxID=87 RepID=UPI001D34DBA9|nr:DUF262 domain-containing HNH endonuclease family protein [Hyphomonas sp.]MBU3921318.1 DUF262 domain-containing HNH endonuclease family protein [Alphaproteobacteria bacterium]MBU4063136.1 DUF262 domain-containing HNH endonuclease family protein [Alphaproteobacteria bacterium]MBU4164453.1 DUF262 domain-containing HNH endonuclease family protein [Alphaproteobacteria bacterium]
MSEVFAPGERLRMPPYQRSYSWGEAEALELLGDLLEATEAQIPHFIGAVVFVHGDEPGILEIVDGQQRLTTLTILLCVLRDLETDKARAQALHALIADEPRPILGEGANWRIALNYQDGAFFRDTIQRPGATLDLDADPGESESQGRMAANAAAFHKELSDIAADQRRALAEIAMKGCALVRVVVDNKDQGFKVFRVLNTRGKEPGAHDIIKTELFQRARFTSAEAARYAERWSDHEAVLGGNAFDDLLRQIRMIFDRGTKGDIVAAFQKGALAKIDARKFLDEILPAYVRGYRQIETAQLDESPRLEAIANCLHQMRALEQQNWRAPALHFLAERGADDPAALEFFQNLERLAYVMQLLVHDRDQRGRRFARVTEAVRNDRVLLSKTGPFAISREEGRKTRERLIGRFATFGQRRAIALRLNAALAGGRTIPPESDATVEHVLPRTIPEDSHWLVTWPDAAKRREQCDTIGNFVLLTTKVNQKADRLDYRAKKEIYFNGGGGQEFALTRDLMEQDAWTPEIVRKRTEKLAGILADAWGL